MSIINEKFYTHKKQYFLQSFYAGIVMIVVLFLLASVVKMDILGAIGASSLGSTTCLVLMAPKSVMSKAKNLFGGYTLGLSVGVLCYFAAALLFYFFPFFSRSYDAIIFGALALMTTQFLMVIFDVGHSPAAGIAIGLVMEDWHFDSLVVIIICVLCLSTIRYLLSGKLINLV